MAVVTESLNDPFKFKINGGEYYCRFLITDAARPEAAVEANSIELTKSAIVSMDIHESLFEPHIKGSITLNNPYDYIENHHFTTGGGDDFLHVELIDYQVYKEGNERAVGSAEPRGVTYANEKLKYSFVITTEDNSVSKSDRSNNFKTYQLLDINWFLLNKRVVQKIAYPPDGVDPMPMGDMIKDLLKRGLGRDDVIDESNWSSGDHVVGKPLGEKLVEFEDKVRPAQHWRYADLIKYLIKYNYCMTGQKKVGGGAGPGAHRFGAGGSGLPVQLILQYNRNTDQYSLIPLDMYFKNNKTLVIEAFGVGDLTPADARNDGDEVKGNPVDPRDGSAPVNRYTGMLNNTDLTTPYTQYTNEFFVNYYIHNHNSFHGSLPLTILKVSKIAEEWDREFIKEFEIVGGEPVPFLQFKEDPERMGKPMAMPKFSHIDAVNIGKAQMVSNFTFYNLQLNIVNVGDTNRRPGRFVDVFKPSSTQTAGSDAKLLGRWFITSVHHRFLKDQYQTVLQCVKLYTAPEKWMNRDLTGHVEDEIPPLTPVARQPGHSTASSSTPGPSRASSTSGPSRAGNPADTGAPVPPLPGGSMDVYDPDDTGQVLPPKPPDG